MTNEEIDAARLRLQRVVGLAVNAEEAKMAFGDIDALCAAAGQNAVMRELCEAASCLTHAVTGDLLLTKDVIRFFEGIDAYRAMK